MLSCFKAVLRSYTYLSFTFCVSMFVFLNKSIFLIQSFLFAFISQLLAVWLPFCWRISFNTTLSNMAPYGSQLFPWFHKLSWQPVYFWKISSLFPFSQSIFPLFFYMESCFKISLLISCLCIHSLIHKFNRCWEIKNKNTKVCFLCHLNCTISENENDNYDNNNDAGIWQVLNAYHLLYI